MATFAQIEKTLKKHNQIHLLAFWDNLSPQQREKLLEQIVQLDFNEVDKWVAEYVRNPNPCVLPPKFDPAPYYPANPLPNQQQKYGKAVLLGKKLKEREKQPP
jgi:hypothetical protein